jgi:hypothetical protein
MEIEKVFTNAEEKIEEIMDGVKKPLDNVVDFIKKHKKIIFMLVILYATYSYLFDEPTEE